MTGGNVGLGALAGGIGGAIGGAVGFKTLKWDLPGRVAAQVISGSVSGGIASVIHGGNFWQGMAWGAAGAAIASGIGAVIEIATQTRSDHGTATGGDDDSVTVVIVIELPDANDPSKLGRKGLSGHSGVAIGEEYYDYGPTPGKGANPLGSPGRPWWDRFASPTGDASFSQVKEWAAAQGYKLKLVSLEVSRAQAETIRTYWQDLYANPGTYRFYGRQCTTTVAASLRQARIFSGHPLTPQGLYRQLTAGNLGRAVRVESFP
jgi:hypothetical protein